MENKNFIDVSQDNIIQINSQKRGDIPYYTLSQVASLLNENEQDIRYYTNIFDDILKIEIVDKNFIYTDSDIDKLEFIIKLKNKGMTIKQINAYCDKLSLDKDKTYVKESSSVSIDDFINILMEAQSKEFVKLEKHLSQEIESSIEKHFALLSDKLNKDYSEKIQ